MKKIYTDKKKQRKEKDSNKVEINEREKKKDENVQIKEAKMWDIHFSEIERNR